MTLKLVNKISGVMAILLSITVAIPLTIKVMNEGGGPWGFEIISLAVLVPLSCYLFFGVAGMMNDDNRQRQLFVFTNLLTVGVGLVGYFVFPLYPLYTTLVPIGLAVGGVFSGKQFKWFLLVMIFITIYVNAALLKWELDLS